MMRENEHSVPPPGVVSTVTAGFDLTAKHVWLTLLPILLDLLYWLGPRLSFGSLVERILSFWGQESLLVGIDTELLMELAPRTNLFTSLSLPLLGVPAFVVGLVPEQTPLPTRVVELENAWVWGSLLLLFGLLGLLLTAIYYGLIGQVVRHHTSEHEFGESTRFAQATALIWLQLIGLVAMLMLGLFMFYLPLVLISSLLSFFSNGLAMFILLMLPIFGMWLVFYLSLVPHGLVLNRRPFWRAIRESIQLIQRNMIAALGLIILIMVISRGLDWLLLLADDGSWFTLISISGHAFVSTSLVVATFIFYRDRYLILKTETRIREK